MEQAIVELTLTHVIAGISIAVNIWQWRMNKPNRDADKKLKEEQAKLAGLQARELESKRTEILVEPLHSEVDQPDRTTLRADVYADKIELRNTGHCIARKISIQICVIDDETESSLFAPVLSSPFPLLNPGQHYEFQHLHRGSIHVLVRWENEDGTEGTHETVGKATSATAHYYS